MSLRARLLTGMAVIAVVLAVAAAFIARTTERHLVEQIDAQLTRAQVPAPPHLGPRRDERLSSVFVGGFDRETGEFVIIAEPNLAGDAPPVPEMTLEQATEAARRGVPFTLGDYRALVRSERFLLVYALPLDDVDDAIGRLVAVEAGATVAVLAVLGLVTWWVVRLGVRPIKRMTETAAAIAAGELSHRVPDVEAGTEAGALGLALNQMLGRIEEAFDERSRSEERLKQFVGDASHELRTPVSTIRGYAELYRNGGLRGPGELEDALRRTEEEAVRMGGLVDDLLQLARLDQRRPLERAPVDLAALVRDAAHDAQVLDRERPITAATESPLVVDGDEARLRQVLANLVTNAVVHTEPGTPVLVRASRAGDDAVVEVVDRGAGMPPEVAARVFERFFRADASRSRHRGGTGLGLAIVDATVAAHGGRVELDTTPGVGTTVRVVLPLSKTS